jgi:hypothetical protein
MRLEAGRHHPESSRVIAPFRAINRFGGNPPAMPGISSSGQ